jgi:hypothetical protein
MLRMNSPFRCCRSMTACISIYWSSDTRSRPPPFLIPPAFPSRHAMEERWNGPYPAAADGGREHATVAMLLMPGCLELPTTQSRPV